MAFCLEAAVIKHYSSQQEALRHCFPKAAQVVSYNYTLNKAEKLDIEEALGSPLKATKMTVYEGRRDEQSMGMALILNEKGKYEPITFMACISPDLKIKKVVLMVYREKIGSEVRKNRFLKQFYGKTKDHKLMINQDIDAVSGATISSWTLTKGVKKALLIIQHIKQGRS
eukprot:COSAG01_NODE_547_length_15635_cov_102.896498_4_plen_170_part_00